MDVGRTGRVDEADVEKPTRMNLYYTLQINWAKGLAVWCCCFGLYDVERSQGDVFEFLETFRSIGFFDVLFWCSVGVSQIFGQFTQVFFGVRSVRCLGTDAIKNQHGCSLVCVCFVQFKI